MSKDATSFDGMPIDLFAGRFTAEFEIAEEPAKEMSIDDVVYVLAVATVSNVTVKYMPKTDELKRINVLKVDGAKVLSIAEVNLLREDVNLNGLYGQDYDFEENRQMDMTWDRPTSVDADGVIVREEEEDRLEFEPVIPDDHEEIFSPGGVVHNEGPKSATLGMINSGSKGPDYSKQRAHDELTKFLEEV